MATREQPMSHATVSWDVVEERFEELARAAPGFAPMLALIRALRARGMTVGLCPVVSMHTLIVGRSTLWVPGHEEIRIDYHPDRSELRMVYREDAWRPPVWERTCPPEASIAVLEWFLFKRVRWLTRRRSLPGT